MDYSHIRLFLHNKRLQSGLRITLGLIFLVAGLAKIFDMAGFVQTINQYDIVPANFHPSLAMLIAYGEVALGLMLLLSFYQRLALFAGSILIVLFSGVSLYYYLKTGNTADCGCFGKLLARQNNWQLFVENAVILGALLVCWKFSPNTEKTQPQTAAIEHTKVNT